MRSGNAKQTVGSTEPEQKPGVRRRPVGGIVRRVRMIHCQEESSHHRKRMLSMDFFPHVD